MITFKPLLKSGKEDELSAILRKLENLFKNRRKKEMSHTIYYSIKGNIFLIFDHQKRYKLKKIEDLSIPDLERLVNIISYLKIEDNLLKEKIDCLLDEKFRKICSPCLLIKIEYENLYWFNPYRFPHCNYEILYHYIIAKEKLGKLGGLKGDKKLAFILRKTYDLEKSNWFKEKYLRPTQNKWVHFASAINRLGILNEEEKRAILKHNAELKINKKLPILAQLWNRVWLFGGLGIRNIEELRNIFSDREFLETKKNICGFLPEISDFEKEDVFAEGSDLMRNKYMVIKNFCNYAG